MTLNEIVDMIEARVHEEQRQDDMENQRVSWLASLLMTTIVKSQGGKKTYSPTELYKPLAMRKQEDKAIVKKFDSREQKDEYLDNLKKKFGK